MSKARDLYKQSLADQCAGGELDAEASGLIDMIQQAPKLALQEMIRAEDGTWRHATVSIQASALHYCSPRAVLEFHHYISFEVGMPDIPLPAGYFSGDDVYGYVPKETIQQYIDELGGIVGWVDDYSTGTISPLDLTDEEITYYSLK